MRRTFISPFIFLVASFLAPEISACHPLLATPPPSHGRSSNHHHQRQRWSLIIAARGLSSFSIEEIRMLAFSSGGVLGDKSSSVKPERWGQGLGQ